MALRRYSSTGQGSTGQTPKQAYSSGDRNSDPPKKYTHGPRGRGGSAIATLTMVLDGKMMQLEAGFNEEFVASLRKSIQSKKRYYDPGDNSWFIVSDQYDKLAFLLDKYFDDTVLVNFPTQLASADSWGKLHLTEGAPLDVVRAVYKTLAKLHHPDRGGDPTLMAAINDAYRDILGTLAETEKETPQ